MMKNDTFQREGLKRRMKTPAQSCKLRLYHIAKHMRQRDLPIGHPARIETRQ